MGLMDQISSLLGGGGAQPAAAGSNGVAQILMAMLTNPQTGGLPGLLTKFQQAGYGQAANSWVASGANQPVPPNAIEQVLGSDMLQKLAAAAGVQPQVLSQQLAEHLPATVDHLTPQGQVPQGDIKSELLAMGLKYLQTRMA
jgi:uncharacterized protein YidB (DUF937 family)